MPVFRETPYANFNFRVIDGTDQLGAFAEVSGVDVNLPLAAYRNGSDLQLSLVPVGGSQIVTLVLRRGVAGATDLFDWFDQARRNEDSASRNLIIELLDEQQQTVVRWRLRGAMPTRLRTPSLTAQGGGLAIEELELKAVSLELDRT